MKELLKAQEIHKQVQRLNDEIVEIKSFLNLAISDELNIKVTAEILRPEKHKEEPEETNPFKMPSFLYYGTGNTKKEEEIDFRETLNPSEIVVMFSRLLELKKEYRKVLINEFKKLHLRLKI